MNASTMAFVRSPLDYLDCRAGRHLFAFAARKHMLGVWPVSVGGWTMAAMRTKGHRDERVRERDVENPVLLERSGNGRLCGRTAVAKANGRVLRAGRYRDRTST